MPKPATLPVTAPDGRRLGTILRAPSGPISFPRPGLSNEELEIIDTWLRSEAENHAARPPRPGLLGRTRHLLGLH